MARPSRPTARIGLPSSPAPRSRSTPPGRGQDYANIVRPGSSASERPPGNTPVPPLPTSLPPQRSYVDLRAASVPHDRWGRNPRPAPPPPPLPLPRNIIEGDLTFSKSSQPIDEDLAKYIAEQKGSALSSTSSVSSATSSARSSFNTPSPRGYASSATSIDSAEEVKLDDHKSIDASGAYEKREVSVDGFGSSLWTRVAAAAGNLTISVSKAWAANVATLGGEITPPGTDSRLVRAMKAYHIAKARELSDLPEWLFDERERGVSARGEASAPAGGGARDMPTFNEDIFTKSAATSYVAHEEVAPTISSASSTADLNEGRPARGARGVDRLKEMRQQKRSPTVRFAAHVRPTAKEVREEAARVSPNAQDMRPKVSLPKITVGPGRRPSGLPSSVRPSRTQRVN